MTCSKSRLILRHFLVGKYTPPVTPLMFDFMDCLDQGRRGGGEETRSGTEKRCSHNLQSGHPAWWSADNYSVFPTVK